MSDEVREAGTTWPAWCWMPMGGFHAYLSEREALPGVDVARVAALTTWRLGRGVYLPDDAVVAYAIGSLRSRATAGAADWEQAVLPPVETWAQLPQWCCYLVVPPDARPADGDQMFSPHGVFVHLEHDSNSGRPELRLLIDTDGTWDGLLPIPVYLDRPTLGSALADMGQAALAGAAGITGADVRSLTGPSPMDSVSGLLAWLVLPLALSLIDPDSRFLDPDSPGSAPAAAQRRPDGLWPPASATRGWRITYRSPAPHLRLVPHDDQPSSGTSDAEPGAGSDRDTQSRSVLASAFGSIITPGRVYPHQLPGDLAVWYLYVVDSGHSIAIIPEAEFSTDIPFADQLCPAPVRSVMRVGWRIHDGFVVADVPYDRHLGVRVPESDSEY